MWNFTNISGDITGCKVLVLLKAHLWHVMFFCNSREDVLLKQTGVKRFWWEQAHYVFLETVWVCDVCKELKYSSTDSGQRSCIGLPCNSLMVIAECHWVWSLLTTFLHWFTLLSLLIITCVTVKRKDLKNFWWYSHHSSPLPHKPIGRSSRFLLDIDTAADSCVMFG